VAGITCSTVAMGRLFRFLVSSRSLLYAPQLPYRHSRSPHFGLSGAVAEKGDPWLLGIRTTGQGRYEENRGDMLSPTLVGSLRFGYFAGAGAGAGAARLLITTDAHNHGKHSPFRHNKHGTRSRDSTAVRNRDTHKPERGSRRPELSNHM